MVMKVKYAALVAGPLGLTGCIQSSSQPIYAQPIIMKLPNGQENLLAATVNYGAPGHQTTWFANPPSLNQAPQQLAPAAPAMIPEQENVTVEVPKVVPTYETVPAKNGCGAHSVKTGTHTIMVQETKVVTVQVPAPQAPVQVVNNGSLTPQTVTSMESSSTAIIGDAGVLLSGTGELAGGVGSIIYGLNERPDNYTSTVNAVNSGVSATGGNATGGTATAKGGDANATGGTSIAKGGNSASTSTASPNISVSSNSNSASKSYATSSSSSYAKTVTPVNVTTTIHDTNNNNNDNTNTNNNKNTGPTPPPGGGGWNNGGGGCTCSL